MPDEDPYDFDPDPEVVFGSDDEFFMFAVWVLSEWFARKRKDVEDRTYDDSQEAVYAEAKRRGCEGMYFNAWEAAR